MKILKGLCILVPLALIAAGIGAYFWLQSYIKTPEFIEELERVGSAQTKGDLTLSNVEVQNWGLHSQLISLSDAGHIKQLVIRNLDTKLQFRALLEKVWRLDHLQCKSLVVKIDNEASDEISQPSYNHEEQNVEPEEIEISQESHRTIQDVSSAQQFTTRGKEKIEEIGEYVSGVLMPTDLEFNHLNVEDFGGVLKRDFGSITWKDVSLSGAYKDKVLQLQAKGGAVQTPIEMLSQIALDEMYCSIAEERFIIQELQASLGEQGGSFKLHGEGNFEGDVLDLQTTFTQIPLATFLRDQSYGEMVSGNVRGEAKVACVNQKTVTEGIMNLDGGKLHLPQELRFLSHLFGSGSLDIHECQATVKHTNEKTALENIVINIQNIFFVEGQINIISKQYDGIVRVGVSQTLFSKLPSILSQQYHVSDGRYFKEISIRGSQKDLLKNIRKGLVREFQASFFESDAPIQDILKEQATKFMNGETSPEEIKGLMNKGLNTLKSFFN